MSKEKQTPNDQQSTVKNPNSEEFKKAQDNRANQLNENNLKTKPETRPVKTEEKKN